MTLINGAKASDVEDILASIRTTIAERGGSPGSEQAAPRALSGSTHITDDIVEFELPAIFKSAAQQPTGERPNLLGRLSEVLSTNDTRDWDRSRVIPFEPVHGRMIEPPPVIDAATEDVQLVQEVTASGTNEGVKREMPTFFDTRLNRMGELSRTPAPQETPPPQPPKLPPPQQAAADANSLVEDAAAQLLRPILKQWLTENMPKIVEKALRSEGGDDGTGGPRRR